MEYRLNKIYSDYANVHQVCKEALQVSDNAAIEAVLIGGSLLGMVRDKDFLPWDKDVDFAVFEEGIAQTIRLESAFRDAGFECRVHHLGKRKDDELIQGLALLQKICDVLKANNVEHCLLTGALLNLYRDAVLYPEIDTLALLFAPENEQVWKLLVECLTEIGQVYVNSGPEGLKSLTLVTPEWRVNLFNYIEKDQQYGWTDLNCEHWFDQPLLPAQYAAVNGWQCPVPVDPEGFLQARYGKNWQQKPQPLFSEGRVPGSVQLYKDGVMVDYIFHYIRGDKTYWYEPKANVISTKGFVPFEPKATTAGNLLFPVYPEVFLEEHYGDWRTPVKKWDGAVDNPTIIDSDEAMKMILGEG